MPVADSTSHFTDAEVRSGIALYPKYYSSGSHASMSF